MDSYDANPIKRYCAYMFAFCIAMPKLTLRLPRRFRIKWPWEQDRQMALYNRSEEFIQIASQPDRVFMEPRAGITNGWCLSHLPNFKCFISHYCADSRSKQVMRRLYETESEKDEFEMRSVHFDPI